MSLGDMTAETEKMITSDRRCIQRVEMRAAGAAPNKGQAQQRAHRNEPERAQSGGTRIRNHHVRFSCWNRDRQEALVGMAGRGGTPVHGGRIPWNSDGRRFQ